jgi:arylsulfatase
MKIKSLFLTAVAIVALMASCSQQEKETKKPNIIYILADDLGYGELGCYGQELIETPNIDALAKNGIRFTDHYSGAPVCAPSRCVLLTGKHTGHAYVRGNDEWRSRGKVWDYKAMIADSTLEGQRPMPADTKTVAKLLKAAGYKTGMVGKWGLGAPNTHSLPTTQGFDFFCGYNCQRQAHTYYPVHLYKNANRIYLNNDTVAPNSKLDKDADPLKPESYAKFNLNDYSPDVMFDEMINFVEESNEDPFFVYWATPIPHLPLQAPQKWVDYYVKKFGEEDPYLGNRGYFPHRYPRAAYAAMVSYLDERVGQLVAKLKELGVYDNTLIIFTSDNGPSYTGGCDSQFFKSGGPFKSDYGWGKGFVHEGGIRVPMIASWPGKIKPGTQTNHASAFWDVLPTLCDVAGVPAPEDIDGISYLPAMTGASSQKQHDYLYWEFPAYQGQQAVRMGKWKGIRKNIFKDNMEIELYNLDEDISEQNNIASQHPEVVEQIKQIMLKAHTPAEVERFKIKQLGD